MRVCLVHNPGAGDTNHSGEKLVELVATAGHQVDYRESKGSWHNSLDDRPDLIAVAGGDGTVGEVTRATIGRAIPITILPTGTANNIAGWLGLTGIPNEELVAGWTHGGMQPFDLGVARGPWGSFRFLESIGIGLLAGMMSEIKKGTSTYVNELDGRERRIAAALAVLERLLRRSEAFRCEVRLDGLDLSGDYLLVEILNFGVAGPNLRLAPEAHGADGMLDVVLVHAHERGRLERHLSSIETDSGEESRLRVQHARHVSIHCEDCTVHLDDELWTNESGEHLIAEANVQADAVTFLVPSSSPRRRPCLP